MSRWVLGIFGLIILDLGTNKDRTAALTFIWDFFLFNIKINSFILWTTSAFYLRIITVAYSSSQA